MRLSEKRYLHHCSFRSEKNHRTGDKLVTLMKKVCCQLSPFSHTQVRRDQYTNLVRAKNRKSSRDVENERIRILFERQKRANFRWSQNRDPEARISSRFWWKKYPGIEKLLSLNEGKLIILLQVMNNSDEIFFKNNIRTKSGSSWSSYQKFSWDGRIVESSRVTSRWIFEKKIDRKSGHYWWIHGQNSGTTEWSQLYEWFERFQRCWISAQWTIPRSQSTSVISTLSWSWEIAKPQRKAARYLGYTWYIGKRFCKSTGVFLITLSRGFNPWTSNVTEDTSPHVTSERHTPDTALDPRCQSGPSARNSFDPKEGRFSKDCGADQQRLQISERHFD